MAQSQDEHNCSTCVYRNNDECEYFLLLKLKPKKIPKRIFPLGCKEWEDNIKNRNIIEHIIKVFDGTIMKDEKQKPKQSFKREKIYKDTRHKYGERKDW